MPTPPYAQMQVALGGGAPASGYLQAAPSQSVLMSGVNTTGWTNAIWEIYDAPPGLTLPAGWSASAGGLYQYTPASPTTAPPLWNTPAAGSNNWGKFMLRLRINGNPLQRNTDGSFNPAFNPQLTDEATILWVPSPTTSAPGIGFNETTQGDALRGFAGPLMVTLRAHETALVSAGGWVNKLVDHDCTADSSVTIADGNNTIGGLVYQASNHANTSRFLVTPATGWEIWSVSANDYDGSVATAPCLRLKLNQLTIPNLSWSTKLRLWLHFEDSVDVDALGAGHYEATAIGIDAGYTSGPNAKNYSRIAARGIGPSSVQGVFLKASVSGGGQSAPTYDMTATSPSGNIWGGTHWAATGTNNVIVCETLGFSEGNKALFGTYSGGWPSESSLNPAVSYHENATGGYLDAANINSGSLAAANAGPGALVSIVFACPNNTGASPYKSTLLHWRLDYRN